MTDVLLVSMPFGPLLSPSLGLSLLQPQVCARGLACEIAYGTLRFADEIGQSLYHRIASEQRVLTRGFAGEWIFSGALFAWSRDDERRYVDEILRGGARASPLTRSSAPSSADIEAILAARRRAPAFLDRFVDEIARSGARLVGFTSVFQQHLASLALARRIKSHLPGVTIVFGGANCEGPMGLETVRQFPFVDAAVSGEGDLVFADLAARVVAGEPFGDLPGVLTRAAAAAGGCATTAPAVRDLDALPFPDYRDFFRQFDATRAVRGWEPSLFMETSRGCWWGERMHCTFCGLNGATMAFRAKSAPRALAELDHLSSAHAGCDIQIVDNILDLQYFRTLLPALAARRKRVRLFYETKSNLKKDQVRLLRDAGVLTIQPGIESFSDEVLKLMKKGVSGLQNVQLLKWCKELGVEPLWNFLVGFPGETADEYARMAADVPAICHLPAPTGVTPIRLDRFSPNFNDADRLGFARIRPLPFYAFLYDLPEEARRNLAYYFAYDYRDPRELARYAGPLARRVHAWRTAWRHAELVSIDLGDRLVLLDSRPSAVAPIALLDHRDRELYFACDAIADAAVLARGGDEADIRARLARMVDRRLMLADGSRHLALAVPLDGDRLPAPAAARLARVLAPFAVRDRRGWRLDLTRPEFRIDGEAGRATARGRTSRAARRRSRAPRRLRIEPAGADGLLVRFGNADSGG
jgi:ribosomal peptide maturation radical SAM protein 1